MRYNSHEVNALRNFGENRAERITALSLQNAPFSRPKNGKKARKILTTFVRHFSSNCHAAEKTIISRASLLNFFIIVNAVKYNPWANVVVSI